LSPDFQMDWLRVTRLLTHYVAPGLAAGAAIIEIIGRLSDAALSLSVPYNWVLLVVFSLLTASMIGWCGWIVCLWDLDRLFLKLETRMDSPSSPRGCSNHSEAWLKRKRGRRRRL
jgi:hypothetical protein